MEFESEDEISIDLDIETQNVADDKTDVELGDEPILESGKDTEN